MKKKAHDMFSGQGDAAFGDTVFNVVWANVKGTRSGFTSIDGETGDYSSVWTVERDWENRTSLIVDPPDGRMPPMTAEGKKRRDDNLAAMNRVPAGPEDRPLQERCITYGSPSLVAGYQSAYEIVQGSNAVVLTMEMIHDTRVIALDARPHVAPAVRQWLGDSRGHWEGDTLVVETTNFRDRSAYQNANADRLRLVERFTRTAPKTVRWEVTVDDPTTWTKPWTFAMPLTQDDSQPFQAYECHEGNYGVPNILSATRAEEKAAGKK